MTKKELKYMKGIAGQLGRLRKVLSVIKDIETSSNEEGITKKYIIICLQNTINLQKSLKQELRKGGTKQCITN